MELLSLLLGTVTVLGARYAVPANSTHVQPKPNNFSAITKILELLCFVCVLLLAIY